MMLSRILSALAAALACAVLLPCIALAADAPAPAAKLVPVKLPVVIVTGGHGYDKPGIQGLFEGHGDIVPTVSEQKDHSELFEDIFSWPYEVIVFYNQTQQISEKRQKNLLALLEKGVGVLVLHHGIISFQAWPDFEKITGGRYAMKETVVDGAAHPKSGYKKGVALKVHIEDPAHPITQGLTDFSITDETFSNLIVSPKVHVILSTDEPSSERAIGWVGALGKARTCYIESGHGAEAFKDPNYRTLIARAVRWLAGRLPEGNLTPSNYKMKEGGK